MGLASRHLLQFVAGTYAVSWGLIGAFVALGGRWEGLPKVFVGAVFMLVPGAVALVLERRRSKQELVDRLGLHLQIDAWWLLAWLLPLALVLGSVVVAGAWPDIEISWSMEGATARFAELLPPDQLAEIDRALDELWLPPLLLWSIQGLVAGVTANTVFALGEELGWRGLMHAELASLGLWRESAVTGVLWGLWHAPIVLLGHNYPQHPVLGVLMMVVLCLLLSPLHAFVRKQTGSVVAAAVLHGTINATAAIALVAPVGGSDLVVGLTGAAGFVVLLAANGLVLVLKRSDEPPSRGSRSPESTEPAPRSRLR